MASTRSDRRTWRKRKRYSANAIMNMPNIDTSSGSSMSGDRPESVRKMVGCTPEGIRACELCRQCLLAELASGVSYHLERVFERLQLENVT